MRKMQYRLFLARRMTNKGRKRRHRTVAVGQHFGAHNRINGGRFPRLHGSNNSQHHFQTGYFAQFTIQHRLLCFDTTRAKMQR